MNLNVLIAKLKSFSWLRYGDHPRPHRDWLMLLSLTLIVLAGSLVWNVWFFFSVVESELASETTNATQESLDRSMLDNARNALDAQEAEGVRYRDEYRFVDPSL